MRKILIFGAVLLMLCAVQLRAETMTVRLPEIEGQYMTYETVTASFDLGTLPSFIGQARIRFKGTFYPGRAYFWYDPPEEWFYYGDETRSIMDPPESQGYWRAYGEYFETLCSFDDESTFSWSGTGDPSWTFLTDGQGEVNMRLSGVMPLSVVLLEEAKAYIDEAYLMVEEEIRVISPNGGEALPAGTTQTIEWTDFRSGGCQRAYELYYSTDNDANWILLAATANKCSYDWWLVSEVDSNDCLVRVIDANDADIYDTSDDVFTIYQCTLDYDLTGDCLVNFADFAMLSSEWLQCGNPFDPNCQP